MRAIDRALADVYRIPPYHPDSDPLGGLIATVLSQNTSDLNSSRAYASLRLRYPTWDAVRPLPRRRSPRRSAPAGCRRSSRRGSRRSWTRCRSGTARSTLLGSGAWMCPQPAPSCRAARRGAEDRLLRAALQPGPAGIPRRHPRASAQPANRLRAAEGQSGGGPAPGRGGAAAAARLLLPRGADLRTAAPSARRSARAAPSAQSVPSAATGWPPRRLNRSYRSPITRRTSAMVSDAIARARAAPSSRIAHTRSGSARNAS